MFVDLNDFDRRRITERAFHFPEAIGTALLLDLCRWDAQCFRGALAAVRVPILVIQSTRIPDGGRREALKPGMTVEWVKQVREGAPTAQVAYLYGVGHFAMLESPKRVCELLSEFITPLSAGKQLH